jgi:NDP-sugar pyrophosphorylase family protein
MKAMILAAGLGTRLLPLTLKTPKVLVPIANRPVIDWTIDYLKSFGVQEIVVNSHHHCNIVSKHLNHGKPFGILIDLRFEPKILGTGGGIKNTADFWSKDPFIVINGDILTDINLSKVYEAHRKRGALATLVLHDYEPFNKILIDKDLNIADIPETYGFNDIGRLAFTGIQILEPEVLDYIPTDTFSDIMDCHRYLIRNGKPVGAYIAKDIKWHDIGTVNSYILANKQALGNRKFLVGDRCKTDKTAYLKDWAVVGNGTILQQGSEIRRSILWDNVKVKDGVKITDSIVTYSKEVSYDLIGIII